MLAFIGLGNVGHEYKRTKHNAGFWVVDEFSRRKNLVFNPGEGEYVFTKTTAKEVLLIKPTAGMNRSGLAVKSIVEKWNLVFSDIYIIIDDVDLPLGKIRIRPKGGDGCHRGLENIIYQLQTKKFPRIRLGIADGDYTRPSEKYVLKPFDNNSSVEVGVMINSGADAIQHIITRGLSNTMNQFNV